jgi:hypothetical protein
MSTRSRTLLGVSALAAVLVAAAHAHAQEPQSPQNTPAIALEAATGTRAEEPQSPDLRACCSAYRVGGKCCNVVGCNCDGPCWNAGCQTACQQGQYPGRTVSCNGNDGYYNCCPTGSRCKSAATCAAKLGQCCCTGEGRQIISLSVLEYDFKNAKPRPDSASAQVFYKYKGENAGPAPRPVGSIETSITSTQTNEWSFESTTEISATAKVQAGIPFFGQGELQLGVKQTFKHGEKQTTSVSTTLKVNLGNDEIPAFSYQQYQFNAAMFQYNIPFKATAVVLDDCGQERTETVNGSTRLSGIASFTAGEFSKIVGPAVPVECTPPFDTPIQDQKNGRFCSSGPRCADNAVCKRLGLPGDCCVAGEERPCCAVAAGHTECLLRGYKPSDQICPAPNGTFASCCNKALRSPASGN